MDKKTAESFSDRGIDIMQELASMDDTEVSQGKSPKPKRCSISWDVGKVLVDFNSMISPMKLEVLAPSYPLLSIPLTSHGEPVDT